MLKKCFREGKSMKKYIGIKFVEARPMTRNEFNALHEVRNQDSNVQCSNEGYIVRYEDGYISWSPKEIFEKAYRESYSFDFGIALEFLKRGLKVARKGWNGKKMFLFLINGAEWDLDFDVSLWGDTKAPFIAMKTADYKIVPWVASQTDMLSDDWIIIK